MDTEEDVFLRLGSDQTIQRLRYPKSLLAESYHQIFGNAHVD